MGAIYGLIASGFCITYMASKKFNFALGMWVMLGAMLSYTCIQTLGFHPLITVLIVTTFLYCLGWVTEPILVRPFAESKSELWVVSTLAFGLFLIDLVQILWGKIPLTSPEYFGANPIIIGEIRLRTQFILIILFVCLLYSLLHHFFYRTLHGKLFRAVASDRETAKLFGADIRKIEKIAFAVTGALAGIAGFLILPITGAEANIGTAIGFKAFAVAIIGGLNSPRGVLALGLLFGFMEAMVSAYLYTGLRDIVVFSIMIIFLFFRPFGIFGSLERESR